MPAESFQHWCASGGKSSPKTSLKLLHAEEREVLKRAMSLLMERSQENTAVSKLHPQQLWFSWQITERGTAGMSINLDIHLGVNTWNNNAVVASSAEKYVSYYNTRETLP